ncbi:SCO0930 family lipoprotein [Streptomyces sp. H10-C2]|uniref:SCO0930 family lipoprotein n=1 Tax=unclassified Streptomyces TaxID=2593676 RepID=UPI0024B983DF|nr:MULTISPECIES: SCO0930 family lipoprotein [unclassified Streptomyces]MDJ0340959.1 SCO0930 family lipoprotein [Streptomyces sp. PH10-H1]MDJ0369809.1 SCO0930 family lipoprotein [Streptomyces sp. H10-C2]
MVNRRRAVFAGAATVVFLLTAGCSSNGKTGNTAQENHVQPAGDSKDIGTGYGTDYGSSGYGTGGSSSAPSAEKKGEAAKVLAVRSDGKLGPIVTDSKGFTLYRFDKDTAQPSKSNCVGACAITWPAVPADDASASAGIKPELLGEVARADGSRQLTLAGWPVYRYAMDTQAGDTKGHGVGGTWNALAPDGKKAGQQAAGQAQDSGMELAVTDNAQLGKIIVDGQWRTLYRFNKDSAWPMKFGCVGACLDTWKPAKPVDKTKVSGVATKLVGTVTRPDGTKQLAINCWPVYWFTGDLKPGDINGQGKMGLWFAVTQGGKKAGTGS